MVVVDIIWFFLCGWLLVIGHWSLVISHLTSVRLRRAVRQAFD
ncbi:MAG: hypothetical protein KF832_21515 [Caldilineaceae bacterium]|nr:hypothetical protein [Caldilineaceae bacterium]